MRVERSRWITALALAIALSGPSACSTDSPSAPGGDTPDGGPNGLDTGRAATAHIGSEGGTVRTSAEDGTGYTLVVPPGAVSGSMDFRITPYLVPAGADSLGRLTPGLYLEPAGTVFDFPLGLVVELPVDPPSGTTPAVVMIGENGNPDVILPTTASGRTLTAEVEHFSSVAPAAPTEGDLQVLWNSVVLEIQTFGESIERIETLVSLYLFTLNAGQYPNLPVFPDWPDEIHSALTGLIAYGGSQCATGHCIDGTHVIFHARNQASMMLFTDLEALADSAEADCSQPWLGIGLTYPPGCGALGPGDRVEVTVTAMLPGVGPASELPVALALDGPGSLASAGGTTDANGSWRTVYTAADVVTGSPPVLRVSMPDGCDPSYEVARPINAWNIGDTNGRLRFELEYMSTSTSVCCGPGDDERWQVFQLSPDCVPPIGTGGQITQNASVIAPWGPSSSTGRVRVGVGSFSVSGGLPPSHTVNGDVVVNGNLFYSNPGGQSFGPDAVLRVRMNWSHAGIGFSMVSGGTGSASATWPAGSLQTDIPLTEGSTGFRMSVGGDAHGGGGTITLECVNCP